MPQAGSWGAWQDSNLLSDDPAAAETYTLTLSEGYNMSYLEHYTAYAGTGGGPSSSNFVNITQLKVLYRPVTPSD